MPVSREQFDADLVWPAIETIITQNGGNSRDILTKGPQANRSMSKHTTMLAAIKAQQ